MLELAGRCPAGGFLSGHAVAANADKLPQMMLPLPAVVDRDAVGIEANDITCSG